ncbi:hypothetical protein GCM10009839_19800 [Catenulispora yoronensis]|uniref:Uncharacterized protein n=1 Tax=Catenulispora yoronensis TaxID=450799 RepID=A0ABN2TW99_9ACTN
MFRRSTNAAKTRRDLGVKFCDGQGVSTQAERSDARLDALRASAVMKLPRF